MGCCLREAVDAVIPFFIDGAKGPPGCADGADLHCRTHNERRPCIVSASFARKFNATKISVPVAAAQATTPPTC